MENKRGRQLPRTDFILQNENAALRNKVKILEESLVAAYKIIGKTDKVLPNIISLAEENEKLKNENNQLRIAKEKAKLEHTLYC
jgi:regulator of replication initiation timing